MVEGGEVEGGGIDSFYEKQKGGVPLYLASLWGNLKRNFLP